MISITLEHPIVPEGVVIRAELSDGRMTSGLDEVRQAVSYAFNEADKDAAKTPSERRVEERMEQIERAIESALPAEVKLELANKRGGK